MHKTHNSNKTILITCVFILVYTLFLFYTCLYFLKPILILELYRPANSTRVNGASFLKHFGIVFVSDEN